MIHGITVTLYQKKETGVDAFKRPIYEEVAEQVANVLVSPTQETEVLDVLNLTGRKAVYTLAIPKGDVHNWENVKVEFFGKTWRTIGMPISGIEELVPLQWNMKVRVENYGTKSESHSE